MGKIEVEVRGGIKNFEETLASFRAKAKFVKEKDRFSMIYMRKHVKDLNEIKDDPVDLRIRVTDKKAEIIMKYGQWGSSDERHEISIPIKLEDFDEAIQLFKYLGWDKGQFLPTKTYVFDYKGIEFALVDCEHYDYFEAEKIVGSKDEIEKAKREIEDACKELKLEIFKEEEFMEILNNMINVQSTLFDLSKQDFSEIKQKFKEFF